MQTIGLSGWTWVNIYPTLPERTWRHLLAQRGFSGMSMLQRYAYELSDDQATADWPERATHDQE